MALSHDTAESYYRTNFNLTEYYGKSYSDIKELDDMIPFEREIYIQLMVAAKRKANQ